MICPRDGLNSARNSWRATLPDVPLILASASPRRLQLLASIGVVPDEVIPADIDETPLAGELPKAYVLRVAREKAEKISALHPQARILAADTVVVCGRRILPKAEDAATARLCLDLLSGRRHRVMTAVAFYVPNGKLRLRCDETVVTFSRLSDDEKQRYVDGNEWDGKAGGYAIQGSAQAFIPAINGSVSNVIGLPLHMVKHWL